MKSGYLCLFLHAHLPFVRHPEAPYYLEENWLFEAITETYIPLLSMLERLYKDKVPFCLTMSLTPTLVSMLGDELLLQRYSSHLDRLIELSGKEIARTVSDREINRLARMYQRLFVRTKNAFCETYNKNLISAFSKFQNMGCLEIVASCATHAFLPNSAVNPQAVHAQINVGIDHYIKSFGRKPKGFWLPECGYYPDVDVFLQQRGIRYFFLDSHGIASAQPKPANGVYAPLCCPSGVVAFGRDPESSKQVWSADEGYPGDPYYREYYRDIGHELPFDYIKPYIDPCGIRINTGIKYWRITGKTETKELYQSAKALKKVKIQATHFVKEKLRQIEVLSKTMTRKPMVVAPFDAELFGHWWFEGPKWLETVIRTCAENCEQIQLIKPSTYLKKYPENPTVTLSFSSWGYNGYGEFWLNATNDWIWRHIHSAEKCMAYLANRSTELMKEKKASNGVMERAIHQAARELMLLESSDWPFIMKAGAMTPYAEMRIQRHASRFIRLYNDIINNTIDSNWLEEIENGDNIFADSKCAQYYREHSLTTYPA
jgi:1,4-alpha-glucan branching enzyme